MVNPSQELTMSCRSRWLNLATLLNQTLVVEADREDLIEEAVETSEAIEEAEEILTEIEEAEQILAEIEMVVASEEIEEAEQILAEIEMVVASEEVEEAEEISIVEIETQMEGGTEETVEVEEMIVKVVDSSEVVEEAEMTQGLVIAEQEVQAEMLKSVKEIGCALAETTIFHSVANVTHARLLAAPMAEALAEAQAAVARCEEVAKTMEETVIVLIKHLISTSLNKNSLNKLIVMSM